MFLEVCRFVGRGNLPKAERWTQNAERRTPNAERRTLNAERRTPNAERRTLNAERWTQNAERRTQNAERRTQNAERQMQNAECRTPNAEHRTLNAERRMHNTERRTQNAERRISVSGISIETCAFGFGRSAVNRAAREIIYIPDKLVLYYPIVPCVGFFPVIVMARTDQKKHLLNKAMNEGKLSDLIRRYRLFWFWRWRVYSIYSTFL